MEAEIQVKREEETPKRSPKKRNKGTTKPATKRQRSPVSPSVRRKKTVSRKGMRTRAMASEVNEEDCKIKEEGVRVGAEPRTPSFSPLTDTEDLERA